MERELVRSQSPSIFESYRDCDSPATKHKLFRACDSEYIEYSRGNFSFRLNKNANVNLNNSTSSDSRVGMVATPSTQVPSSNTACDVETGSVLSMDIESDSSSALNHVKKLAIKIHLRKSSCKTYVKTIQTDSLAKSYFKK